MDYREMVKVIPLTMRRPLSERLIDVLLEAKEGAKVPSSTAKTILFYWQRDQLHSEAGLINLLRAVERADPMRATAVLADFDLSEIKLAISPAE